MAEDKELTAGEKKQQAQQEALRVSKLTDSQIIKENYVNSRSEPASRPVGSASRDLSLEEAAARRTQAYARSIGQEQHTIDNVWNKPIDTGMTMDQRQFNVTGGTMLTTGNMMQEYLSNPKGEDTQYMISSLVKGRFLDPKNAYDTEYFRRALSEAAEVRSAVVDTWQPGDPGVGDFFMSAAAYQGNAPDRFAPAGGGAYNGPVSSVTEMNETDLRSMANQTAGMLVGRAVSEAEFKKMLKKVRKAEAADPRVTDSSVDGKVSIKEGLSAQGRQNLLREELVKTDEADGVIKATTMMDNFDTWLRSKDA